MRTRALGGDDVPILGAGTWNMERDRPADVLAAIRLAIDLGMTHVDTAELYGDGVVETLVGRAIAGRRDAVYLVSKVLPSNASRSGTIAACERSLARLGTDRLDLYLLHWPGRFALAETVAGMRALVDAGKIRRWGVSNFDVDDLDELWTVADGSRCVANQVYYSASERGIEFDLLPAHRKRALGTMAYCPIDQGSLASDPTFTDIGQRHGVSAAEAALAWVLRQPDVIAIPKAGREQHLRQNLEAAELGLTARDMATVDARFPPPRRKQRLAMT